MVIDGDRRMRTVERILRKIHALETEVASVWVKRPNFSIVEYNNKKEWIKALRWVLESEGGDEL